MAISVGYGGFALCDISPMNVAANILMNPVADLDLVETAIWVPKLIRRDYQMVLSQVGNGVDDPDQNYPENYG